MKQRSEHEIRSAEKPEDIFTMDLNVMREEKEAYLQRFRPKPYCQIRNFVLTQRISLLYDEAVMQITTGVKKVEKISSVSEEKHEYLPRVMTHSEAESLKRAREIQARYAEGLREKYYRGLLTPKRQKRHNFCTYF